VPVEDGDIIIEWDLDHGEYATDPTEKWVRTKAALDEQQRLPKIRTHAEVLAHTSAKERTATTQQVSIVTPPVEPIYYGAGKGLHHRTVDAEGDVQESAVDAANVLQPVEKKQKKD